MIIAFILTVTIFHLILTVIWNTETLLNTLVRLYFAGVTIWGVYILFHLLPAVEMSKDMKLL